MTPEPLSSGPLSSGPPSSSPPSSSPSSSSPSSSSPPSSSPPSSSPPSSSPSSPRRPARPRRERKIVAWVVVSILIVIVASLALLGYRLYERAMAIQAELTDAQTLLPKVTQAVASFDFDAASATLDEASAHTQKAVALTDGWPWSAAEAVPVQGKNAVAVTELAVAAAGLETRVRATAGAPARRSRSAHRPRGADGPGATDRPRGADGSGAAVSVRLWSPQAGRRGPPHRSRARAAPPIVGRSPTSAGRGRPRRPQ